MADEIYYSGLGDLMTSEVLSGIWLELLADRNALPSHPALIKLRDANGLGSTTQKIPHVGLFGYDKLASTAENASIANTAFTDASTTVAVARYGKAYESSDLARLTDAAGLLQPGTMALDAFASYQATLRDVIANLVDDFSQTVGTTTVDATVVNFLDAITTLEVGNVGGPYLCILHPQQWADIRKDAATSSGGAIQWNAGSQALLNVMKGAGGYKGNYLGVDVFCTTDVPTANAGADRAGGMFGRGAIAWAEARFPATMADQMNIGPLLFEQERNALAGRTAFVTNGGLGASEGIDAAGVSIITDA